MNSHFTEKSSALFFPRLSTHFWKYLLLKIEFYGTLNKSLQLLTLEDHKKLSTIQSNFILHIILFLSSDIVSK